MNHVGITELRQRRCGSGPRPSDLAPGRRKGFDLDCATSLACVLERIAQPLPTLALPPAEWAYSHSFVCLFALCALLALSLAIFFPSSFKRLLRQLASQVFEDLNSAMCVLGLAQGKRVCTCLLPLPS